MTLTPAARRREHPGSPRLRFAVQYAVAPAGLPPRSTLRRWAISALERDAMLTLRFVGTAEGRRLNLQFRGRDYATNVLTFVYDDLPASADAGQALSGDIVVCVPVLKTEARDQGRTLRAHCAHLVVHGVLHLQGYVHERVADALLMERREAMLLRRLRYPDPYATA